MTTKEQKLATDLIRINEIASIEGLAKHNVPIMESYTNAIAKLATIRALLDPIVIKLTNDDPF